MLRIAKRERLLALAIVAGEMIVESPQLVAMSVSYKLEQGNLAAAEHRLLQETGWISHAARRFEGQRIHMVFYSAKFRIYKAWLYRGRGKTLTHVLQYMYSPLFAAMLYMHCGKPYGNDFCLTPPFENSDLKQLVNWFQDVLSVRCLLLRDILIFTDDEFKKLTQICLNTQQTIGVDAIFQHWIHRR